MLIEVKNLSKAYGSRQVVSDISFAVKKGSCFGLLGPNGAGKSTTMKILTGILEADSGSVLFEGTPISGQMGYKQKLGYVPQEITLFNKLTAEQNLVFFGELYGLRGGELKTRIQQVLAEVGLRDYSAKTIQTFSGGMKRRINIAAALLHNPQLLILDEPTVGIDPQSRNHIFELIQSLQAEGVTIIYVTHYMEEVETLCDELAVMDHGKIVTQGTLEGILEQYGERKIYMEVEGSVTLPHFASVKNLQRKDKGWLLETADVQVTMRELIGWVYKDEILVNNLEVMKPSLERIFLDLTGTSLRDQ